MIMETNKKKKKNALSTSELLNFAIKCKPTEQMFTWDY